MLLTNIECYHSTLDPVNLYLCLRAGISSCLTSTIEQREIYMRHAPLANMAANVCRASQQPEHTAAFTQASLHSVGFTYGFGKLVSGNENRTRTLQLLPRVLQDPEMQRRMPGAFSQETLSKMAACCDRHVPESHLAKTWLPRVINSHESWCSAVAPLLTRLARLYR